MSARRLVLIAVAAIAFPLAVAAVNVGGESPAAAGTCTVRTPGDIDGDGYSDALVGQPARSGGTVSLIRGGPGGGLTTAGNQLITLASLGLGPLATVEGFGLVAKTGFFDSDCYADAVIGEEDWTNGSTGAIVIVHGSSTGLNLASAQRFTAAQIKSGANQIGTALAVGDFNHDGYDDVALGAFGTSTNTGGVGVLYGTAAGLSLTGRGWFTQDTAGVPGTAHAQYQFGRSIAAGDFNHDGYTDLAVGVPDEDVTRSAEAGDVIVLPGSAGGLTGTGSTIFSEDTDGVPGVAETDDGFGFAVAAGDVTGDGYPDLIVGVINEHDNGAYGAVFLLRGSASGITATGSQYRDQSSAGFPVSPVLYGYGSTLAVADLNRDGYADIVSGAGATVVNTHDGAGAFAVLYGTSAGLSTTNAAVFTQDSPGMPGTAQVSDDLGVGIQILPVTATGYPCLIVAASGESNGTAGTQLNGGIEVLKTGVAGVTTAGAAYLDGTNLVGGIANYAFMGYDQPADPGPLE